MLPAEFPKDLIRVRPSRLSSAAADVLSLAWALKLKRGYLISLFS